MGLLTNVTNLFKAKQPEPKSAGLWTPTLKPGVSLSSLTQGYYKGEDSNTNRLNDMAALRYAFQHSYWVRKCLKAIAMAGTKKFEVVPRNPDEEIDPAKKDRILQFLNNLNDTDSFESFCRKALVNQLVFGSLMAELVTTASISDKVLIRQSVEKAFGAAGWLPGTLPNYEQEIDDVVGAVAQDGVPFVLRLLLNEEMEIVSDDAGTITKFVQHPTGKSYTKSFNPNQIFHVVYPDSSSATYGDSQIECLTELMVIDGLIDKRQKYKLMDDNSIDRVVQIENGTQDNCEKVGKQLETVHGGPGGLRTLVVDKSWEFNDVSKTKDGDFLNQKNFNRDTIAMILGVPVSVLGDTSGNSMNGAGADSHYRNFIEGTVRPLVVHFESAFNRRIMSMFQNIGIDYVVKFVLEDADDQMPMEQMFDIAVRNATLTPNEKRRLLNLEPYTDCGDEPLVFSGDGATPLKTIENPPAPPPAPAAAAPDDEVSKASVTAKQALRELRKALG